MDTNSSLSNQIFFVPLKTSSIQFNKKYISHYVSSSHALYSSPAILKSSRIALRSTNWSFYELKAYWLFVQFKSDNPAKDDDELSRSSEYRISAGPLSCSWWALVIATVTRKSILWGNIWVQIMIIFLWTIYDLIGYLKRFDIPLNVVSIIICLSLHVAQVSKQCCSCKNRSHHLKMLWPPKTNKTWFEVNQLQSNPVFRFDWYIFGGVFCVFCVIQFFVRITVLFQSDLVKRGSGQSSWWGLKCLHPARLGCLVVQIFWFSTPPTLQFGPLKNEKVTGKYEK